MAALWIGRRLPRYSREFKVKAVRRTQIRASHGALR